MSNTVSRRARHCRPRQSNSGGARRVALFIDTPNLFRSLRQVHGPSAHPDYEDIYERTRESGVIVQAAAFVNDGVSAKFVRALRRRGYEVVFPHAPDVDDAIVARAVTLHGRVDRVVIASGDGDYCALAEMLRACGIEIIVTAVGTTCSRRLKRLSNEFVEIPVLPLASGSMSAESNSFRRSH